MITTRLATKMTLSTMILTLARWAMCFSDISSLTSAIIIDLFDKSTPAFAPISCKTSLSFSSLRPATPQDNFSSNLMPSSIVCLPAESENKLFQYY